MNLNYWSCGGGSPLKKAQGVWRSVSGHPDKQTSVDDAQENDLKCCLWEAKTFAYLSSNSCPLTLKYSRVTLLACEVRMNITFTSQDFCFFVQELQNADTKT